MEDTMRIHNIICHSLHRGAFEYERKNGAPDFLLIYFHTPTLLDIDGDNYTLEKPSIVIFSDYKKHKYISLTQEYYDDFIHFDADMEEDFLRELHFPLNKPIQILNEMCITENIGDVYHEWKKGTEFSSPIQHHLMMLLFWRLAEEWHMQNICHREVPYFDRLQEIRKKIQNNPGKNWKVGQMAAEVSLSPAYFQVLYKKAFGVTCMTDVIQTKISTAKEYLLSTDMSVASIAEELGYAQVYHFIRQFKKYAGLTPGAFRKSMRQT